MYYYTCTTCLTVVQYDILDSLNERWDLPSAEPEHQISIGNSNFIIFCMVWTLVLHSRNSDIERFNAPRRQDTTSLHALSRQHLVSTRRKSRKQGSNFDGDIFWTTPCNFCICLHARALVISSHAHASIRMWTCTSVHDDIGLGTAVAGRPDVGFVASRADAYLISVRRVVHTRAYHDSMVCFHIIWSIVSNQSLLMCYIQTPHFPPHFLWDETTVLSAT